jgi:hypothetical protein
MQEQIIVVHIGDAGNGVQVSNFETTDEASRYVEDLIEAGFTDDRIDVYRAVPLTMQVRQKPVVSIGEGLSSEMRIPEMPRDEFNPREDLAQADLSSSLSDLFKS